MVRHFKSKKDAKKFLKEKQEKENNFTLHIFKKLKGHKNRTKKPFVVCTGFEWLNLY